MKHILTCESQKKHNNTIGMKPQLPYNHIGKTESISIIREKVKVKKLNIKTLLPRGTLQWTTQWSGIEHCTTEKVFCSQKIENLQNVQLHAFFISNTFISNARLKLAKNPANATQYPEAELLLFQNYPKIIGHILKNKQKKQVCLYSSDYRINHNENEDKNEKHRYDENKPRSRY